MAKVALNSTKMHNAILDALENALNGKTDYIISRNVTPEVSTATCWSPANCYLEGCCGEGDYFMIGFEEKCSRPIKGKVSIQILKGYGA